MVSNISYGLNKARNKLEDSYNDHYLGDNVVELGEFLAFLISLAVGNAHLLGGVEAQGVHDVTEVVQVEFTFAIPVVDVTNLLDS